MSQCRAVLYMWDGEYEGECLRSEEHEGPHWDGLSTWRSDEHGWADHDTIDKPEDRERFT